ncbi:MAG: ABC transporter permease, partial [Planctomycetota bacterium]
LQADEGSGTLEERGKTQLRQGRLDAYVVVDADILEGPGKIRTYTYEPKPGNQDALGAVENTVRNAVRNRRYEKRDLDSDMLDKLRRVQTERIELGPADEERIETEGDRIVRMMAPFFFMYLLFLGIIGMGQQMLSSIIEEKNSRVIEVLLSALSPFELMAGKILGLVGVGLTVVSLWGFSTYFAARYQGLNVDIGAAMLSCFVLYYVLAFFLFSSLMVGIGSICNTIKETQSLLKPVIILCVVPIIAWQNIIQDPNGTLARALSFFPLTTPMVMILRLSSGSDIWIVETLGSIVLLAAAVLGSIWVAARVFRTGILMYGKRPGLREVGRWLRQA